MLVYVRSHRLEAGEQGRPECCHLAPMVCRRHGSFTFKKSKTGTKSPVCPEHSARLLALASVDCGQFAPLLTIPYCLTPGLVHFIGGTRVAPAGI